jgi:hypothetical protein
MRYKTFRTLTPAFVLAAVLCLAGLPVSAAPRSAAAAPAVETGWLSGIWQWLGQLWTGGGEAGLGWQSQASAASTTDLSDTTTGTQDLQASGKDFGPALDPNGYY